jgi:vanillate O-demethylase monooxygenase subunit
VFLRNCWYVAAWSHEVADEGFLARTIIGLPIVLWRDSAREVVAFVDRCCHRGAPLSKGRREVTASAACITGCCSIAAGSASTSRRRIRFPRTRTCARFPSSSGIAGSGSGWATRHARIPPPSPTRTGSTTLRGAASRATCTYDVSYRLITDNLLDFSHLAYVHATTLGGGGSDAYAACEPQVERLDRGVKVTRWLLDDEPAPFVTKLKRYLGKVDRWNIYDFVVPGILLMDSGSAPAGTGAPEGRRVDAAEFRSCQALTPETEHSTHYFFQQMHNFALDRPEVTQALYESIVAAFHEDQAMITAQSRTLAQDPDFEFMPIVADSALAQYARMLEKLIAEEGAAGTRDAVVRTG